MESPGTRAVVLGLQGAQTQSSIGRGIARFAAGYARALLETAPDLLAQISVDADLAPPLEKQILQGVPLAASTARPSGPGPFLYHVLSPFEFLPALRLWPSWARSPEVALGVTVHDLVPLLQPQHYLLEPVERRSYMARLGMIHQADAVLAISEATARDTINLLGIDPERVFTVYEDCGPEFQPTPLSRAQVLAGLRAELPSLREGFVLYVGGEDWRKNLGGMVAGYARLPAALRARHQLVVACRLKPADEAALRARALAEGIGEEMLLTGFVTDPVLLGLYQAAEVFVFPSFYEGFGLPVLEAMRCGAPVVVADVASLQELVPDPALRFDPADPAALASALARVLLEPGLRESLRRRSLGWAARFSWNGVVANSRAAYEYALSRRRRLLRGRAFRADAG